MKRSVVSGIEVFRYFIALLPLKRQRGNTTSRNKNWTEKDSNKKINTKTDNKAEEHKKGKKRKKH